MSYYANVKLIDDQVGEILAAVKRKYGENALILFTADHGEMLGNHGLWGKHNCANEEVRNIPFLACYPYQDRKDTDNRLINSTDILPVCVRTVLLSRPVTATICVICSLSVSIMGNGSACG